ncbi:SDR family oxidoreductase [Caulobacter sp. 17J65-9]|uniref:SDR family oxidoreductase n=1 Tax=Caulobacter sp. 17J65-9 TaxID=2709382 RepID=UPI0013CD1757|nr:SDR family oxidoreductase [Caulobacter sp. 17J65-9]NEX94577.1 SDR family oxidoreductase [Caulobacter sp. 17J65-9]
MKLFVFGYGYLGSTFANLMRQEGWRVAASARDPDKRARLAANGIEAVDPDDPAALAAAVEGAHAILVTSPPGPDGCPGLKALAPALAGARAFPDWIGYVSTTGVYGDRGGGWVFEESAPNAPTVEGARRLIAERDWRQVGRGMGLTVCVFRLPAIYGPGRSAVDKLKDGTARLVRKPGQVFNRIHVEDAADALLASLLQPRPGAVYNVCDDEPVAAEVLIEGAAQMLGLPLPPEVPWTDDSVSDAMRRFYTDNKRVSNARLKAELNWRPRYPTWREGLADILAREA